MIKSNKIRQYYGIFLTLVTLAVGVAFIVAAAQIYYGGIAENPDYPYELDRIRQNILVPFILLMCWIAVIIGGFIVSVITPDSNKKPTYIDHSNTLTLLKKRVPASGNEQFEQAKSSYRKNEIARKCVWGAVLTVCLAASIAILTYAYNFAHYHADDLHGDILNLVKNVLSWTGAATICGIVGVIVDCVLLKREIALVKTMIANGDRNTVVPKSEIKRKTIIASTVVASVVVALAVVAYALVPIVTKAMLNVSQTIVYVIVFAISAVVAASFAGYNVIKDYVPDKVNKILQLCARIAVGVVAIVFIVVGITNDGANDVLIKAINICTECIGLG